MNKHLFRTLAGLSVAGALAGGAGLVHAQQAQYVQARVISATPIRESTGSDVNYNVTYEYNGRQYTTRTATRPGSTIAVQASAYGVTTSPVAPQSQMQGYPVEAGNGQQYQQSGGSPWDNVVPEPGVVVGAGGPPPVYVQPAPVYAAPVYVDPGYAYGYGYPYAYPPVGISLNLGYSRGWGGGYYRGGGYGYRGYGGFRGGWHR
ncbi:hypothetical protein [Variovorax sp. PAMC26660]|uniref:hypothetical protein n=1 Tax=Variovorax sp. PAMC26660 TaxID=2762322 RepID=UPI00164E6586|nr:hypothetical protein [Variovorax sp. PAMC26660]QNK68525.1 hypothetical protein H7F35_01910 [Variovorax sp. PAMC26660]